MKKSITSILLVLAQSAFATTIVDVADYGAKPQLADNTPAIVKALNAAKKIDDDVVVKFPKGEYNFGPKLAPEKYCFISNNDESLKRIIFDFENAKDLTIDGQGSKFIFHGEVHPMYMNNSKNITLKNFTNNVSRPFHSEGKIVEVKKGSIVVEIANQFMPFAISDGKLVFPVPTPEKDPLLFKAVRYKEHVVYNRILEFSPETRGPAYLSRDFGTGNITAKKVGNNKVELFSKHLKGTVGNIFVFGPLLRLCPSISVSNSEDIVLDNVTINAAGGMGLLGQYSKNITVKNSKVTPAEGRIVSATADATHFVNCTGKITLKNNLFENQLDDATNIHGIYEKIDTIESKNTFLSRITHFQQYGFKTFKVGDTIEFVGDMNMKTIGTAKIKSIETINKQMKRIVVDTQIPESVELGDAVAVVRQYPDIIIKDNIVRRNRARGMLLNCRGKTVVEGNLFQSSGSTLLFEGDASHWYEQGGVSDCTIRNNIFDNCKYAIWGKAVISVEAGIKEDLDTSRYNKNILIEGNTFNVFDNTPLLNIFCVENLTWKDNKIVKTTAYPARPNLKDEKFIIKHCDNIIIDGVNVDKK